MMDTVLVSYKMGVCSQGVLCCLRPWHLGFLIPGLRSESLVTGLMLVILMVKDFKIQEIYGLITILFQFIHTVWTLVVLMMFGKKPIVHIRNFKLLVWASLPISFFRQILILQQNDQMVLKWTSLKL